MSGIVWKATPDGWEGRAEGYRFALEVTYDAAAGAYFLDGARRCYRTLTAAKLAAARLLPGWRSEAALDAPQPLIDRVPFPED